MAAGARHPLPFALVDVFAASPLTGNPLAVVADGEALDEPAMRAIAREFNQSETTFVLAPEATGADWRLRSFTPAGAEVVGAGHNALGAWWWLAAAGRLALDQGPTTFIQQLGDRALPVEVEAEGGRPLSIAMEQAPPEFGAVVADRAPLAASLGVRTGDLGEAPAQVVSTGAAHLLVPARDRDVVDRAQPDAPRLAAALAEAGGQGCYLYSLDPPSAGATAYARFFNPTVGIWEDPATGSAAGPLAAQLAALGLVVDGRVRVEQGRAMGRPSFVDALVAGERVRISGACVVVAEGRLVL
jgi:trans-2,3-dihydro-3-hydroxyanthranilate isomerase